MNSATAQMEQNEKPNRPRGTRHHKQYLGFSMLQNPVKKTKIATQSSQAMGYSTTNKIAKHSTARQSATAVQETSTKTITKESTIGDVVAKYPQVIETLLSLGVHCVGCHVSQWETLEQGFAGHGMSEEEIDEAVKQLNEVLQETPANGNENLILTLKAANKIKKYAEEQNKKPTLRIQITAGGCSGSTYGLDFDDKIAKDDIIVEVEGAKVLIDPESLKQLKGATIDYVDGLQGAGFKISNPNAKKTCGCGQSFS